MVQIVVLQFVLVVASEHVEDPEYVLVLYLILILIKLWLIVEGLQPDDHLLQEVVAFVQDVEDGHPVEVAEQGSVLKFQNGFLRAHNLVQSDHLHQVSLTVLSEEAKEGEFSLG